MSQYYLMAQLPSLDGISETAPLPITEERFDELCSRFLGKKALQLLNGLTLAPPREGDPAGSALIDAWNEGERQLRLALGSVRAAKLKKTFDAGLEAPPAGILQIARAAVDAPDPMEAERLLNRYRLEFLETLRPMDAFSDAAVYYYGLKLKLMQRIWGFDEARGEAAYRAIYDSIMNGDKQEVRQ